MKAIHIILGSALITAAAIKAAPALAEPSNPAVNVSIVHTADLDLATEPGRRQLEHRLASAARQVCGVASDADLAGKNEVRRCRDDVLARARASRDALLASNARDATIKVAAAR
jgi:UrcA family protein